MEVVTTHSPLSQNTLFRMTCKLSLSRIDWIRSHKTFPLTHNWVKHALSKLYGGIDSVVWFLSGTYSRAIPWIHWTTDYTGIQAVEFRLFVVRTLKLYPFVEESLVQFNARLLLLNFIDLTDPAIHSHTVAFNTKVCVICQICLVKGQFPVAYNLWVQVFANLRRLVEVESLHGFGVSCSRSFLSFDVIESRIMALSHHSLDLVRFRWTVKSGWNLLSHSLTATIYLKSKIGGCCCRALRWADLSDVPASSVRLSF